jgi:hypothetical protein
MNGDGQGGVISQRIAQARRHDPAGVPGNPQALFRDDGQRGIPQQGFAAGDAVAFDSMLAEDHGQSGTDPIQDRRGTFPGIHGKNDLFEDSDSVVAGRFAKNQGGLRPPDIDAGEMA